MQIDKPAHQQLLLELLNAANFPGQHIELAFEVKQAVKNADIASQVNPEPVDAE